MLRIDGTCRPLTGEDFLLELDGAFLAGWDDDGMVPGHALLSVVLGLPPALLDMEVGGDPATPAADDGEGLLEVNCCIQDDDLVFTPKDM